MSFSSMEPTEWHSVPVSCGRGARNFDVAGRIIGPDNIEPVFAKVAQDRADAVVRGTGTMLFIERARVGASALKHRLPVISYVRFWG
jgi:hypothetical protein